LHHPLRRSSIIISLPPPLRLRTFCQLANSFEGLPDANNKNPEQKNVANLGLGLFQMFVRSFGDNLFFPTVQPGKHFVPAVVARDFGTKIWNFSLVPFCFVIFSFIGNNARKCAHLERQFLFVHAT